MNCRNPISAWRILSLWIVFLAGCGVDPCYVPPNAAVDGAATATIKVWNDLDANGQWDSGEAPLPWVTFYSEMGSFTDANGEGSFFSFQPGCPCDCWKGVLVSVDTPFNYQATTPTEYELTGNGRTFFFGFHSLADAQVISFPGEPEWFRLFINRGVLLTSFHYNLEEKYLLVEMDHTPEQDDEQLYSIFFRTIYELAQIQIVINKVTMTTLPANETSTCLLDDLLGSEYSMTNPEILRSICSHP